MNAFISEIAKYHSWSVIIYFILVGKQIHLYKTTMAASFSGAGRVARHMYDF